MIVEDISAISLTIKDRVLDLKSFSDFKKKMIFRVFSGKKRY